MPGLKQLKIAVIGRTDSIEDFMTPEAAARLAERYQGERIFLEFAAQVAKEAKRLTRTAHMQRQLRFAWLAEEKNN